MPELPEVETVCWRLREGGHGEPPLVDGSCVPVMHQRVEVFSCTAARLLLGALAVPPRATLRRTTGSQRRLRRAMALA